MWQEASLVFRQATDRLVVNVVDLLPSLTVALAVVLITLILAVLARVLLVRALGGLQFDRWADRLELSVMLGLPPSMSASQAVARLAYWIVLVIGLLASLTALNAAIPSRVALSIIEYMPHLLAALFILAVGIAAARFLARSVLIGAVNQQIQSARLLSLAVKWLVLIVAVAMALDQLGIGRSILLLAFGIFFGGIVLAGALAVGLGARDVVSRTLERQLYEATRTGGENIDHV